MIVEISERRALSLELLQLTAQIATVVAQIEEKKAALRKLAGGTGAKEGFDGLGEVTVSKDSVSTIKGVLPTLDVELYLAMSKAEQDALPAGLVTMQHQYSQARAGSVTIKLSSELKAAA